MGRKFNRTTRTTRTRNNNMPKPQQNTMPKPQQNTMPKPQQSGVLGSMAQGASMGAGMAVGSEMIHSLFSSSSENNNVVDKQPKFNGELENKCSFEAKQFQECINNNKNDLGNCQVFYNYLEQCSAHVKNI